MDVIAIKEREVVFVVKAKRSSIDWRMIGYDGHTFQMHVREVLGFIYYSGQTEGVCCREGLFYFVRGGPPEVGWRSPVWRVLNRIYLGKELVCRAQWEVDYA